ncbi:hypothetical protein FRC12_012469 [Ceratobasidium sp. 428]|nr:hypothetical protein FRC12_012469 [Ceratobasidium sp. 428]
MFYAPINTLPPEILSYVFTLSRSYCACTSTEGIEFHDLAVVCTYWREIALNTTTLWTHIDVGPGTPTYLTKLLLKRTRDVPIHAHVYEPPTSLPRLEREASGLLAPHAHRVRTVHVESYSFNQTFIRSILNLWLGHSNNKNILESLVIYQPYFTVRQNDEGTTIARSERAKRTMAALTTLQLQNVSFGWNSVAYHDLVDLRLAFTPGSVSISILQLVEILSASPALATLRLEYLTIYQTEGWRQLAPIRMENLSVLNLIHMLPNCLRLLLPLISTTTSLIEISLGIAADDQIRDELVAFLVRSGVNTLYC